LTRDNPACGERQLKAKQEMVDESVLERSGEGFRTKWRERRSVNCHVVQRSPMAVYPRERNEYV
jgi:hypothetical protein